MPGDDVSMDALRDFAVFAERLNFTRAAHDLHISQPALHVKVRRLAERVGRPLYRREGRNLVLTPEGEVLGRFGRQVDDQLRALLAGFGGGEAAPVVLAAGEGAHLYVLAPGVQRLLASGFRLRLVNADATRAVDAVVRGDADIAVAVIDTVPDLLDATVLATYPQLVALPVGHRLGRQRTVALADLDGEALVVPPPGRPLRRRLEGTLRAAGAGWRVAVEAEGWQAMLRFVALGAGVAVVNGCVRVADGDGVVLRPVPDLPPVAYTAVFQPGALDDLRVAAALDAIRTGAP